MKIQLLNKISKVGLEQFTPDYEIGTEIADPDGIMVRSFSMLDMDLDGNLLAIARAGAGVNNIPVEKCTEKGIVVFNTPGANANGVKELVICGLMLASRDVIGGVEWAKTLESDAAKQVEKGKSKFAGTEIKGKTLGIIGLGAIGRMVADTAVHLGMEVIGFDPYLSVEGAWSLNHHVRHAANYEEIYRNSDYITLHVPATPQTKGMINAETVACMKDGVKILNFARADLVSENDILSSLQSGKVSCYVTDFPTDGILGKKGVVAIPHLGASTEESEDNCAVMAALELMDYLENGNIRNSVNFPAISMPRGGNTRLCIFNDNVPDVISGITQALSAQGANIENMANKSRDKTAYTIVDITGEATKETVSAIRTVKGVRAVRVIA